MEVYKITNKINGVSYIGATKRPLNTRWIEHKCSSKKYDYPLYREMKKYGSDNFYISSLGIFPDETSLNDAEKFFIEYHNTLYPNGYNSESGGDSDFIVHENSRKKQRLKHANRKNEYLFIPIVCVETGCVFKSVRTAATTMNLDISHISKVLNKKRNHTGGFSFKYLVTKAG